METRGPSFFIVGAPKCGTTSLTEYLRQHPEIYFPRKKEPLFFGRDLLHDWRTPDLDAYLALFAAASGKRELGEGTVWYLYSKTAAEEIHRFNPRARIIVMIRNPIDALHSLHSQFLSSCNEDISDFESAVRAEEDRKRGARIPRRAHFPQGLFYIDVARFTEQVRRYFDVFGRDRVHVIVFDDFVRDTFSVYRRVLDFLSVDPSHTIPFRVANPNRVVRSPHLQRWLEKPPLNVWRLYRWAPPGRPREALRQQVKRVRAKLRAINNPPGRRPPLREATRAWLKGRLAREVEDLSALLDRDLTGWTSS